MRFARGIFNNRKALCLYGCKDNIHRCADGDHVKVNVRTAQFLCGDLDHAVVEAIRAAQRLKALDVLVNGAHAEIAAAGKRHNGLGVSISSDDDSALLSLVRQVLGVTILPEMSLETADSGVSIRPLSPPMQRTVGILLPRRTTALARRFAEFLQKSVSTQ